MTKEKASKRIIRESSVNHLGFHLSVIVVVKVICTQHFWHIQVIETHFPFSPLLILPLQYKYPQTFMPLTLFLVLNDYRDNNVYKIMTSALCRSFLLLSHHKTLKDAFIFCSFLHKWSTQFCFAE